MNDDNSQIAKVIGQRIESRRKALRMTQTELAGLVDVHQTTVSHWEKGRYAPSRRYEAPLVRALRAQGTGMFDLGEAA